MKDMADVVALSEAHVLLIRRRYEPYKGRYALPGGHVDDGEPPQIAAARELEEETGVHVDQLALVGIYDEPGRDPRYPTRSHAYRADLHGRPAPTAADDAETAEWIPLERAKNLAFDHDRILKDALAK